jgi:putative transposase
MSEEDRLLEQLVANCKTPEEIFGEAGLFQRLRKGLMEKALQAELTHHLGYDKHGRSPGNSRNGSSPKTLKTEDGAVVIEVPRDRDGSFEPKLLPKHQRRLPGLDEKILALYAKGVSVRDIQRHLEDLYQVELSPSLISEVTDAVWEEVQQWQSRPLEALYAVVYLDALMVKMRVDGKVETRAVYTALGITLDGQKELLGMWFSSNEGAKFWMQVLTELRNRGVREVLIFCVDGLKGFPEAIRSQFPHARVQLCIVHMVRGSVAYVNFKEMKAVATDLKRIYNAPTLELAEQELDGFEQRWGEKYPSIGRKWRQNWEQVSTLFEFPEELRRVIYTTNAVEATHRSIRKVIKTKGAFPSEDAARKLIYLAMQEAQRRWRHVNGWKQAMNYLAIAFEDRIQAARQP